MKEEEPQALKVLFADNNQKQHEVYNDIFRILDVAYDSTETVEETVERLESGGHYSQQFIDGFRGGWQRIVEKAKERGIPNIMFIAQTSRLRMS